ncbi:MAG: ATP-binding protein [Candidatus Omnitrophota bacterium]
MTLFAVSSLLTAITSFGMGIFVYFNGKNKRFNKIWLGVTFSVGIWGAGSLIATQIQDYTVSMFWWKITYIGVIYVPVFFFHFVCVFLKCNKNTVIRLTYLLAPIFVVINLFFGNQFLGKINLVFGDLYWFSSPGILYNIFYVLFYLILNLYSYLLLFKKIKFAVGLERTQILYFIVGSAIGWIGSEGCFPVGWGVNFYPVSNFFTALYPIILGYAIVRHQLLDIEIIVKKTLVFAGLFVASYLVFSSFIYVGSIFFENIIQNRWIALIPSVFVIVLMLRPLDNFLRDITDKFLFQKKYDYKQLLKTFTNEVLTVLELYTLVDLTVAKLADIIKLDNAAILLHSEENEGFEMTSSTIDHNSRYFISDDSQTIRDMKQIDKYLISTGPVKKKFISYSMKSFMKDQQAVLVIPLIERNKLIGILSLGKKKSDEDFTQDDIDILLPLAQTLSIAITNAQLFVKLSEAQAQAAQREKMAVIGTLSAGINHEICNPLGIARGHCEMFLLNMKEGLYKTKSQEELLEKAQEIMKKVIHETDRATVITKKLSSFAKPSKDELQNDVSIEHEVNEVVALVEHDLKLDNINVITEIQPDLPFIVADKKQIQEILFNLIRNAAQAIQAVPHRGNILIRAASAGKKVHVYIEDTGVGISKKNLAQIFHPFFTTKEPGKGTGLGLFIVKQVVERNNGHISIQSEQGKGTVFTLVFNAAE